MSEQKSSCEEDGPIVIAGLVAAHISNDVTYNLFKKCLQSIILQHKPLDYFGLSFSCEPSFVDRCKNVVRNLEINLLRKDITKSNINVGFQDTKTSQFRHYEILYRWLNDKEDIGQLWVLFGDADDIWSRNRV